MHLIDLIVNTSKCVGWIESKKDKILARFKANVNQSEANYFKIEWLRLIDWVEVKLLLTRLNNSDLFFGFSLYFDYDFLILSEI